MRKILLIAISLILTLPIEAEVLKIDATKTVELALENSKEMLVANNAIEQAKLNKGIAMTAYLPNFTGAATASWFMPDIEFPEIDVTIRMRGMCMAGINAMQPLFAGGKIIAANNLTKIGITAAEEQRRQVQLSVASNAETSYWTYVAVLSKVELLESYRTLVDTAYTQIKTAVNSGMATESDMLRIEARHSQVQYQYSQVLAGANLCRMALCNAMGLPIDTEIEVADTDINAPIEIPANLNEYDLTLRPEIRLMQADIDAKKQQVHMTRADFLPKAAAQASWFALGGLEMDIPRAETSRLSTNKWIIGVSVQVPLFHWGEGIKKVKHARIDVENAQYNFDHNSRLLNLQVQQAIANVRTGAELVKSAQIAMDNASAALKATSLSYSLGMVPITDLLDAQSQWQSSRSDMIDAQTQLRIHLIDYRTATATLF